MLAILASAIIMYAYLGMAELVAIKEDVKQISRKYMLEMESNGCLEAVSATHLRQELAAAGLNDVELSGTTFNNVGYGNPIYLRIAGNISYEQINVGGDLLEVIFNTAEFPITENRMSTAKN